MNLRRAKPAPVETDDPALFHGIVLSFAEVYTGPADFLSEPWIIEFTEWLCQFNCGLRLELPKSGPETLSVRLQFESRADLTSALLRFTK